MDELDLPPQCLDDVAVVSETSKVLASHFKFKIESFSLFYDDGIHMFESTEFEAGGYKWRLIIYPEGQNCISDYVSVYLAVADSKSLPARWEVDAVSFGIFLHNQKSDKFLCKRGTTQSFHAPYKAWGFSRFISEMSFTEPSNGYLVNDSCLFGAEVYVIKSQGPFECLSMLRTETPDKRSFKISDFSKLECYWDSEEFVAGDHTWLIRVQLCGPLDEDLVSIYLKCVGLAKPRQKAKAHIKFTICDHINAQHEAWEGSNWFEHGSAYGGESNISKDDVKDPLNGYLVGDCCVIDCEIKIIAEVSRKS